ncbi:hypothetical protein ACFFMR_09050 [Micromonospora andamanensis]|uniref:Secreted protein n=1 Tax=Micromonospora andamanensis TaxID=1287068 RepID=A0ABQ4HVX3_9ACTN|nr:hypothetical protein [Micromonospora andamanensis]GIJ09795.1 hypothetical protein Van01_30090 [Micromonospora andamanensis]
MRRSTRTLPVLLILVLAGCAGQDDDGAGVATAGGAGATASASATGADGSDEERRLEFARCMRDNGVEMPDPEAGNGPMFRFDGDVDPKQVEAGMEKCRQLLPNGGQVAQLDAEQLEQMRVMARCMRENGVPDFPDPSADGRIQIQRDALGIDPNDPAFRSALEACRQHAPQFGGGQ